MGNIHQMAHQFLRDNNESLAEAAVTLQYAMQSKIWRRYGEVGYEKSLRDVRDHLSFLSEAIAAEDPTLYIDYSNWVKVLFAGLNFPEEIWPITLECINEALQAQMPPELAKITGTYIQAGLEKARQGSTTVPSFIDPGNPLAGLAKEYLGALLHGDRRSASQMVLDAVENGTDIKSIYLYVFQACQREIGRLWQTNQLSVAQEHYCTAATQLIISQLYPHIFGAQKTGRLIVIACVGGELHELGARMVADFFEIEGWDTYYLGANTPTRSILKLIKERRPHLLGISATITFHVSAVADLVSSVHASYNGHTPKILVGGYPFNVATDLWKRLGADGYAQDAQQALEVASRLLPALS
jgi:methanogenic corrinoid protein MtbC1